MIGLPRSTLYYRATKTDLRPADEALVQMIRDIQDDSPCYGYRRVTAELGRRGVAVNHKRVQRIMRRHGLGVVRARRFVRTTDSDHALAVFANLYRNVIPAKPDLVWVADITYIRLAAGFCYLAAILDACSHKVVGYAISRDIDTQLTLRRCRPRSGTDDHHRGASTTAIAAASTPARRTAPRYALTVCSAPWRRSRLRRWRSTRPRLLPSRLDRSRRGSA